jgi:ribonuclease E
MATRTRKKKGGAKGGRKAKAGAAPAVEAASGGSGSGSPPDEGAAGAKTGGDKGGNAKDAKGSKGAKGTKGKGNRQIVINVAAPEESRIALLEDGKLEAFDIEALSHVQTRGNIYKGKIQNVEPSLQAAFVDIGLSRNAYLPFDEIHPEYYGYEDNRKKIASLLKREQEVVVQVVKEQTPLKGAYVTTYLSIPGRFLVLMPGNPQVGVSRKIQDERERQRLKKILKGFKLPEGIGLIARTVCSKAPKRQIERDWGYLSRLWKSLKKKIQAAKAPGLIYQDRELVTRFLRDYLTSDIDEILVDNRDAFEKIKSFLKIIAPRQVKRLKLYEGDEPIFAKYGVEEQIEQVFRPRVELPSGGYLIIEPTEALVSIDVNSGRHIGEKDLEETALATNLEAAEEAARQLRLRDLGGIVVIDFIDMRSAANRHAVERRMRECLKKDKARTEVGRISRFGLLQLVRQKLKTPVQAVSYVQCPHCKGIGIVKSVESLAVLYLRKLSGLLSKGTGRHGRSCLVLEVTPQVAAYLLNRKRQDLCRLEEDYAVDIIVQSKESFMPEEHSLFWAKD